MRLLSANRFEVIIMGGGITGSSIAYNLVKKGLEDILVIEKECVGCGQTSMSSALIRLHYTDPVVREMAVFSWRFWRDRFQDAVECSEQVFTETGVGFAGADEHADSMEDVVAGLKRLGVDCELYDAEKFRAEIFRGISTADIKYVAWEPNSGHGDPNTSVNCFIHFVKKYGGKVHEHEKILKLVVENNIITKIVTNKSEYEAEYVVNALGVWTNEVLSTIGLKLPITIGMEQVLQIKHNFKEYPPGWGDLVRGFYSRPDGKQHQLIGGLDVEYPNIPPIPGHYSSPPTELIIKRMEAYTGRFPRMIESMPGTAWRGFYDITPDWQPIIGFDKEIKNLIHMVGLSGHGFKLAPAYGDIISDIIIHGSSMRFKVSKFGIERFEKSESRHSKYKFGIVG